MQAKQSNASAKVCVDITNTDKYKLNITNPTGPGYPEVQPSSTQQVGDSSRDLGDLCMRSGPRGPALGRAFKEVCTTVPSHVILKLTSGSRISPAKTYLTKKPSIDLLFFSLFSSLLSLSSDPGAAEGSQLLADSSSATCSCTAWQGGQHL